MIRKRDIVSLIVAKYDSYVTREIGTVGVGKVICPFDETLLSADVTVLFKKGNPLLDRFDILMKGCWEGGLLERPWTELQHRASLRNGGRFRAVGDVFFVFSLSPLMSTFVVLLVGTIFSSVGFIAQSTPNCFWKRRKNMNSNIKRYCVSIILHFTDVK
jgi:hypothetical protein